MASNSSAHSIQIGIDTLADFNATNCRVGLRKIKRKLVSVSTYNGVQEEEVLVGTKDYLASIGGKRLTLTLPNVHLNERLAHDIWAVGEIEKLNYKLVYSTDGFKNDPTTQRIIFHVFRGVEYSSELFKLEGNRMLFIALPLAFETYCGMRTNIESAYNSYASRVTDKIMTPGQRFHLLLGHMSVERCKSILDMHVELPFDVTKEEILEHFHDCEACGKMHRKDTVYRNNIVWDYNVGEAIQIDDMIFKESTPCGKMHIRLATCMKSELKLGLLITNKLNAIAFLEEIYAFYKARGKIIKFIRVDQDGVFVANEVKTWCDNHGILRQPVSKEQHENNSKVEVGIRNSRITGRKLLITSGLPRNFLQYAVMHALTLTNFVPISHKVKQSPWQLVHDTMPESVSTPPLKHLHIFGSIVYWFKTDKEKGSKMDTYRNRGFYLGMPPLLGPLAKRSGTDKNLVFDEERKELLIKTQIRVIEKCNEKGKLISPTAQEELLAMPLSGSSPSQVPESVKSTAHEGAAIHNSNCHVCKTPEADGDSNKLLLCALCGRGFHCKCLNPPVTEIPSGDWYCPNCTEIRGSVSNFVDPDVSLGDMNYESVESLGEIVDIRAYADDDGVLHAICLHKDLDSNVAHTPLVYLLGEDDSKTYFKQIYTWTQNNKQNKIGPLGQAGSIKYSGVTYDCIITSWDRKWNTMQVFFNNKTKLDINPKRFMSKVHNLLGSYYYQISDDWKLFESEFNKIQEAYGAFTVDGASNKDGSNSLVKDNYWYNAFIKNWINRGRIWINPPYDKILLFLIKCLDEARKALSKGQKLDA
jgi:hypothetical protein